MMRPSIDHSILSPSGHCSKRARDAAMNREAARLFPPGFWSAVPQTDTEKRVEQAMALRRTAATLRDLAERGMKPRAYRKEAERLEAKAAALESVVK